MELRDIEYFAVIAQHGNIRRASEALDLSPPALSKSLRRLEKSMQAKLVKRSSRGVELTAVGVALLAQVRRLRLTLDDVAREAADLSQGRAGHLRVGAGPNLVDHLITRAYTTLLDEAPNITMEITVSDQEVMLPMLRSGHLEMIVNHLAPEEGGLEQEFLGENAFIVFASAAHPLAKKKRVTLADLAQERWALNSPHMVSRSWFNRTFDESALPRPHVALETRYQPLRFGIIASSRLLGFTSRKTVQQAARIHPLTEIRAPGFPWIRRDGVIYRRDAYLSPAARRFIELLKVTARNLAKEK